MSSCIPRVQAKNHDLWTSVEQIPSPPNREYYLLAVVTFSQKGRGEREWEGWHLGGGCGLPKAGEERLCPLHPQAQLDVPSCLPQIPKRRKKFVGEQKIVWEFWREFSNSHKKTNWGEQMTNWGGQISNWGRADFKQRKSRRRSEEEQISNW